VAVFTSPVEIAFQAYSPTQPAGNTVRAFPFYGETPMSKFNRAFGAETAFSQLDAGLTTKEAGGGLSIDYDLIPARRSQVPRNWPSAISRFMAPANPTPKPSAHHALPRRNPPLSAA